MPSHCSVPIWVFRTRETTSVDKTQLHTSLVLCYCSANSLYTRSYGGFLYLVLGCFWCFIRSYRFRIAFALLSHRFRAYGIATASLSGTSSPTISHCFVFWDILNSSALLNQLLSNYYSQAFGPVAFLSRHIAFKSHCLSGIRPDSKPHWYYLWPRLYSIGKGTRAFGIPLVARG